jgi:peroxiredoxin
VPGAFTPTCSMKHLPGFVEKYDELPAKGVDTVACVGVNDAFVMEAWGKSLDVGDKILLLADGSAIFTKAPSPHHACLTIVHAQARLGACHCALPGGVLDVKNAPISHP